MNGDGEVGDGELVLVAQFLSQPFTRLQQQNRAHTVTITGVHG
jgi:hypothetical protein